MCLTKLEGPYGQSLEAGGEEGGKTGVPFLRRSPLHSHLAPLASQAARQAFFKQLAGALLFPSPSPCGPGTQTS